MMEYLRLAAKIRVGGGMPSRTNQLRSLHRRATSDFWLVGPRFLSRSPACTFEAADGRFGEAAARIAAVFFQACRPDELLRRGPLNRWSGCSASPARVVG